MQKLQQPNSSDTQIHEVIELLDAVLDVESVRFTIAMRSRIEKAQLILQSLFPEKY